MGTSTRHPTVSFSAWPSMGMLLGVACVVFASTWASISLAALFDRVAPIWFTNAFVLAFLLRREATGTASILKVAFGANVLADLVVGDGPSAALFLSACNTVELSLALWGLRRDRGPGFDLSRAGTCLRFALWGVGAGCAVGAVLAATWLAVTQGADPFVVCQRWFTADSLGLMVVTPLLVSLRRQDVPAWGEWRRLGETAVVLLLVSAVALLVFTQDRYPILFLSTPPIVFMAFLFGFAAAAAGIAVTVLVATAMTLANSGPFALIPDSSTTEQIFLLQLYLAALVVTALPAAASLAGRRRWETDLQEALHKAETGKRAKAAFLATMSHEIRTPLTATIGMSELLLRQPLDDRSHRCAEAIEASSRQLLAIVDDILDFLRARERRLTLRPVDFSLPALVEEVRALFEPTAIDKGLAFEAGTAPDASVWLHADASRLRQILIKLVGNGLKFTAEGRVKLDAETRDDGRGGIELYIRVADSGIGVPGDRIDAMFDPFSQANATFAREHDGTGLGLAISRELVRLMDGEIGCVPNPQGGSVFWFKVPVTAGSPPMESCSVPPRALDILLAEDVLLNQELITEVLERHGHRVTVADNGLALLGRCATRRFDVLLVDIQMPLMDGEEAISRLRASDDPNRETPAIALTANVMEADHERFLRVGMHRTLTKPVAWPKLIDALNEVVESPAVTDAKALSPTEDVFQATAATIPPEVANFPSAPALDDQPVLDTALIAALSRELPPGRFDALAARALREAAANLPLFTKLDDEARSRLAHRLKGTCGSFGLASLAQTASTLEHVADANAIRAFDQALQATAEALDIALDPQPILA